MSVQAIAIIMSLRRKPEVFQRHCDADSKRSTAKSERLERKNRSAAESRQLRSQSPRAKPARSRRRGFHRKGDNHEHRKQRRPAHSGQAYPPGKRWRDDDEKKVAAW